MLDKTYNDPNIHQNNQFNILLEGYEGPIDLLLDLAKKQKVNLSNISILDLAEQYLDFIHKFKEKHLEIAADYLVMAAWLTYLKSRFLLPKEIIEDENTPEQLEAALKYQLQRLEAMQNISKILYSRPLIGRDIFYRGLSEGITIKYQIKYSSTLHDLLKSFSSLVSQKAVSGLTILPSDLFSVDKAIQRLKNMFSFIKEWTNFMNLIPAMGKNNIINKSSVSSNFVASLELAKNGLIEVSQKETFGNIYIKTKQ
jgi:segregation and condensation protein A